MYATMSQSGPNTSSLAEILTIEARVVIASVDTFLHYAREISKIEQAEQEGNLEALEDIEIRSETQ